MRAVTTQTAVPTFSFIVSEGSLAKDWRRYLLGNIDNFIQSNVSMVLLSVSWWPLVGFWMRAEEAEGTTSSVLSALIGQFPITIHPSKSQLAFAMSSPMVFRRPRRMWGWPHLWGMSGTPQAHRLQEHLSSLLIYTHGNWGLGRASASRSPLR